MPCAASAAVLALWAALAQVPLCRASGGFAALSSAGRDALEADEPCNGGDDDGARCSLSLAQLRVARLTKGRAPRTSAAEPSALGVSGDNTAATGAESASVGFREANLTRAAETFGPDGAWRRSASISTTSPIQLRSAHDTSQCLDWDINGGDAVHMHTCLGTAWQSWFLEGASLHSSYDPTMCLDWDIYNQDRVHVHSCQLRSWQRWRQDGTQLRSEWDTSQCLNWDIDNGDRVSMFKCKGLAWQQWYEQPVSS